MLKISPMISYLRHFALALRAVVAAMRGMAPRWPPSAARGLAVAREGIAARVGSIRHVTDACHGA